MGVWKAKKQPSSWSDTTKSAIQSNQWKFTRPRSEQWNLPAFICHITCVQFNKQNRLLFLFHSEREELEPDPGSGGSEVVPQIGISQQLSKQIEHRDAEERESSGRP